MRGRISFSSQNSIKSFTFRLVYTTYMPEYHSPSVLSIPCLQTQKAFIFKGFEHLPSFIQFLFQVEIWREHYRKKENVS